MKTQRKIDYIKSFIDEEPFRAALYNAFHKSRPKGSPVLVVFDFKKIDMDSEFLKELINNPEDTLELIKELVIERFQDGDEYDYRRLQLGIKNISATQYRPIWKIRDSDINQIISLQGYIREISDIQHSSESIIFECKGCGNELNISQELEEPIRKPKKCAGCGCKGFNIKKENTYDFQKLLLEDDPDNLDEPNQRPRKIVCLLKKGLCHEDIDKRLQPSTKLKINGVLKKKQVANKNKYKKYLEVLSIEFLEQKKPEFRESRIEEFKELSKSYNDIPKSMFSTIHGYDLVKKALFLQLLGGNSVHRDKRIEERGLIHILLVGSPGVGKSQLLKTAISFLPNSRFISGVSSTGIGLIGAVVKDEEMGGYVLDAGAVPMTSKSIIGIDEMDRVGKQELGKLNNAMVDLKVLIDKATIHRTLETKTIVLGSANPKMKVFDDFEPIHKQIDMPKDTLDRFDLIFPLKPLEEPEEQKEVSKVILNKYRKEKNQTLVKTDIDTNLIKDYIQYARNLEPNMDEDIEEHISNLFIELVKPNPNNQDKGYFSSRLLTNLIRISTANAKARLSTKIEKVDVKEGMKLLKKSLKEQGVISEGYFDSAKTEGITPKSKREKIHLVKRIIKEKSKEKKDGVPYEDIEEEWSKIGEEEELEEYMKILSSGGDIFEPKRGFWKLI